MMPVYNGPGSSMTLRSDFSTFVPYTDSNTLLVDASQSGASANLKNLAF